MSKSKKYIASVCIAICSVASQNANASGAIAGATEITQLLNNGQLMMQVIEAKSQTVAQIKQLYELYQAAEREILHLKSIGNDVTRLARMAKEKDLRNLLKMIDLSESIYGNVSDLGKRIEVRYQEAYNQGLSIKDYIQNEGEKIERKEKQAVARVKQEQSIVEHLKDDLNDVADLATKIPLSEGTQQSLGLMNTQMNKLLVSMNRIGQIIQLGQENVKKAQEESDAVANARHAAKFAEALDKATATSNATKLNDDFNAMTGKRLNVQSK
ncbi:hypothetical protein V8Z74_15025 [Comamonas sp. w2-DMI]|uniref:hypothetical protein n=1 Tax=Comamonas sp. w2-DMI TaxID=3126391 RepID=UPI0032E42B8F